jgi:RHS repeat-associated protein
VYDASDVLVATISYRYNDQGYRTEKEITEIASNTTQTITYTLSGDKVLDESDGTYQIVYAYDYDGTIIRFYYDANSGDSVSGADYFYLRNQQGDITTIIDNGGNIVVKYRYDAYGNILGLVDNSTGDIISKMNPYTYRGYRYDSEIGYYYLNSRYYNPEIGRFISSDKVIGQYRNISSSNMYIYASNNPVNLGDEEGEFWHLLGGFVVGAAIGATSRIISI